MTTTRLVRDAATGLVALVAAVVSYHHQVLVATAVGEDRTVALILPLSVDGLMMVASMAMLADKKAGQPVRWSARVAFGLGIAASVAANVAAAQATAGARLVASWPALALLMTVELLSRTPRPVTAADRSPTKARTVKQAPRRTSKPTTAAARLARARTSHPDATVGELAKAAKVSERHARRLLSGQETYTQYARM